MNTKKEMLKAQRLLKSGDYEKAIEVLATIDHPTADKWRERAESIVNVQERKQDKKVKTSAALLSFIYFFACFALFFFCVVIIPLMSK